MNEPKITPGMNARFVSTHSSGLSSSPARTRPGALVPDPVDPAQATGTAGAVSPAAPATLPDETGLPEGAAASRQGTSCIRTEDGTVILFDRLTGRAVSGVTRQAAEAAMLRLGG